MNLNPEEITAEVVIITPEMAKQWLEHNTVNRIVRKNRVMSYADQMHRGLWRMTGEPIQKNGTKLLNGQHRLLACIEADMPFTTVVVGGVQDDAMSVMDSGLPRSVGDALRGEGVLNQNAAAAAGKLVTIWRRGIIRDTSRIAREVARSDIIGFVLDNEATVHDALLSGRRVSTAVGLPTSPWAAFCFLISEVDGEAASLFIDMVVTGDKLEVGDPIYALRSWAISSSVQRRTRHNYEVMAVAVKAWNAWLKGEKIKLLKFLPTEELPELTSP